VTYEGPPVSANAVPVAIALGLALALAVALGGRVDAAEIVAAAFELAVVLQDKRSKGRVARKLPRSSL
jgi:hypothetical protein